MRTNIATIAYNRLPDVPSELEETPQKGLLSRSGMSSKSKQIDTASPVLTISEIVREIRSKRENIKNGRTE